MTRRLALVAVLALAVVGVLAGSSSARTETKCIPNKEVGVTTEKVGKTYVTLIVWCGTAKMTIKSNGQTTHYKSGSGMCLKEGGTLDVGFGKFTKLGFTPLYDAALFVIPALGDGTYRTAVLTVEHKGQKNLQVANHVKVIVTNKRSRGTFSGQFLKGPKFTGSFTCR